MTNCVKKVTNLKGKKLLIIYPAHFLETVDIIR
jgi:hypothetical protein